MKSKQFKYTLSLALTMFVAVPMTYAQDAGSNLNFWDDTFGKLTVVGAALVVIAAFFTIIKLFNGMMKMQQMQIMKDQGMDAKEILAVKEESGFSQWIKSVTNATPVEKEMDVLLDHDYDGIGELDNPLPPWWVALFWITIIFAVVYWGYYQTMGMGETQLQAYETEMETAEEDIAAHLDATGGAIDESNVEYLTDEADLARGKEIFDAKCIACHGPDGGGNSIGPNLTDDYWLNGGSIVDIFKTIKYGVPEKGMIAWESQVGPVDMAKVASFIKSLKGTTPAAPKDPQGELYEGE